MSHEGNFGYYLTPNGAAGAVGQGITQAQTYAKESSLALTKIVASMQSALNNIGSIPTISGDLGNITSTVGTYVAPPAPTLVDVDVTFPTAPPGAVLGSVGQIILDPVPVLTAAAPVIRSIAAPTPFTKLAPTAPILPVRNYPDKPVAALPVAKALRELTLPASPAINTVTFEGILPIPLSAPPDTAFVFTEAEYQSMLNTGLKGKLYDLILNTKQTGLDPVIEQQIWDRARERANATAQALVTNISRLYMRSGWTMPQGDEAERVFEAMESQVETNVTESRSIAVAQATLEQSNFQFSFTQAIAFEGQLLGLYNSVQQRQFESSKYVIEAAINLYQIKVAYFNANVSLYTAQSTIYRDKIQAELAKLELYKAQLEGQKLISDLNSQDITNYKAQIDAVVAIFGLYKTELEAVKTQIDGDGLTLQQFEGSIRAYASEISAKSLEYDGYKAELSGEETKATIYNSLVNAFGKTTDAFAASTDAKIKKQTSDIKVGYDVPLQILSAETEAFKIKVAAKTEQLGALTTLNKTNAEIYDTRVKSEGTRINAEVSVQKQEIEYLVAKANTAIEAAKANVAAFISQKELIIGTFKTIAQVQAQLVAAFGSSVNYGASISSTSGESASISTNINSTHTGSYPHKEV